MIKSTPTELPPEFIDRLKRIIEPEQWRSVLESFSKPRVTSFRVNTLKTNSEQVVSSLRHDGVTPQLVSWCNHAFWVTASQRDTVTHSPLASSGEIYVQSLSSILATLVLDPKPDQWNLDLAAAPGGKSSHIVALMNNVGKLSVVEPIRKRMFRLADCLNRMGSSISKTYLMDGRQAGRKVPNRFDRVLLDAPCSSESRMRTDKPGSTDYWSLRKIREQARKQSGLIESAFLTLKPGGTLLYCTCSFAPEENEAIVSRLLENSGSEAEVLPIDLPVSNWQPGLAEFEDMNFDEQVTRTCRILPNEFFDGFYLAKIGKR